MDAVAAVALEADVQQVLQVQRAVDGRHALAQASLALTQELVHVVKSVRHRVHCVHDEAEFRVLLRVSERFVAWNKQINKQINNEINKQTNKQTNK